jgi:hypothetical protein
LNDVRDLTDPEGRWRGPQAVHNTLTRWLEGCECAGCREAQNDAARHASGAGLKAQLLDAIHAGQAFRTALRELRLTPNRVWGLKECRE